MAQPPAPGLPSQQSAAHTATERKVIEDLSHENLDIIDDPLTGTKIRNLHHEEVHSSAEAVAILLAGTRLRATAATLQNDVSSRSHTVLTVSTIMSSSSSGEPPLAGAASIAPQPAQLYLHPTFTDTTAACCLVHCFDVTLFERLHAMCVGPF